MVPAGPDPRLRGGVEYGRREPTAGERQFLGEPAVIVKDLLQKTDDELYAMLQAIGHEPIDWTPVILAELTRRSVVRLGETSQKIAVSSRRLEKLTLWLIVLTVVLGIVALPPAIEVLSRLFK